MPFTAITNFHLRREAKKSHGCMLQWVFALDPMSLLVSIGLVSTLLLTQYMITLLIELHYSMTVSTVPANSLGFAA